MKPTCTRIVFFLTLTILYQAATAQTYNITANASSSSMGAGGFSTCTGCIFNISPGVTFTINTGGTCSGCVFNGGTLNISSSSSVAWDNVTSFNNETVQVNNVTTFQGIASVNDSMQLNSSVTLETNASAISGSHIEIATGVTVTTYSAVTATSSVFALTGNAEYFPDGGGLTLSSSQMYLNGNSYLYANSVVALENTSEIYVGDGSATSHAYIYYDTSPLDIYDNSMIKIANDNNYFFGWNGYSYYATTSSGSSTSYATQNSTINCGGTYPNACSSPYVYGCATFNSSGIAPCTILAVSEIDLTAAAASANVATLTWSDPQSSTAGSYEVQRSTGNSAWTTIASIDAVAGTSGYHYEDASAPAGTDDYRIVRIDKHGDSSYSIISSVSFTSAAGAIGIYPNPASGHTFFISVPNTQQLTVNIYSVTGELLSRQSLQGQLQYQLLLPSQLLPGNAVIVQAISPTGKQAFPLLLQ